jgi:hypothetical protein
MCVPGHYRVGEHHTIEVIERTFSADKPTLGEVFTGLRRFVLFDETACSDLFSVSCGLEGLVGLPWGKIAKLAKVLRFGDEFADASQIAAKGVDDFAAGLARPTVSDPKLNQLIDELYRPGATIGSGSTADAVRYELQTGLKVGGKSHVQKAGDMARALENWLRTSPGALTTDRAAAQSVIDDLWSALDGN